MFPARHHSLRFLRLTFGGVNINSKFRTDHAAHLTSVTLIIIASDNVVSFVISLGGLVESMLQAKLHTEVTPFTSLCDNVNLAMF